MMPEAADLTVGVAQLFRPCFPLPGLVLGDALEWWKEGE